MAVASSVGLKSVQFEVFGRVQGVFFRKVKLMFAEQIPFSVLVNGAVIQLHNYHPHSPRLRRYVSFLF